MGEAVALLALINAIMSRVIQSVHVLVTSGTVTSANILARNACRRAQSINMCRSIVRAWVEAFLDHWHPDAAIWTESEIWPNLLRGLKARAQDSGRHGEWPPVGSNRRRSWKLIGHSFKNLLQIFSVRLAQSEDDAQRLKQLWRRRFAMSAI